MKKRSELLEAPHVFFVDRCLGREVVPEALRAVLLEGERVEVHDQHFAPGTRDIDWLLEVGRRRWVVLSQDRAIARNPLELSTVLSAKVAFFGLARGDAPGAEKGATLALALGPLRRVLRRFGVPLVATVAKNGDVTVKWAGGERLQQVKRVVA